MQEGGHYKQAKVLPEKLFMACLLFHAYHVTTATLNVLWGILCDKPSLSIPGL